MFFLHFFFFDNFLNTYIFLEWSLPVIFGLFIILENIWLFSSSIFIYLNGSKGRKFFFITLVEDFINLFILITRILLQIIRGVICSLYHDFFREISILFFFKIYNFFFFLNFVFNFNIINSFWFLSVFFIKFFFIVIVMTFAVLLMFLQILFLFLAIWLFCKCWFISFYKQKIKN